MQQPLTSRVISLVLFRRMVPLSVIIMLLSCLAGQRFVCAADRNTVKHSFLGVGKANRAVQQQQKRQKDEDFYAVRVLLLHSKLHKRRLKAVFACAQWGKADSRVAAIAPWNWGGCASCNGSRFTPSHTCCMDEIGAREQPLNSSKPQSGRKRQDSSS